MTGGNDFSPLESRERGGFRGGRCLQSEGPARCPDWTEREGRGNWRVTSWKGVVPPHGTSTALVS